MDRARLRLRGDGACRGCTSAPIPPGSRAAAAGRGRAAARRRRNGYCSMASIGEPWPRNSAGCGAPVTESSAPAIAHRRVAGASKPQSAASIPECEGESSPPSSLTPGLWPITSMTRALPRHCASAAPMRCALARYSSGTACSADLSSPKCLGHDRRGFAGAPRRAVEQALDRRADGQQLRRARCGNAPSIGQRPLEIVGAACRRLRPRHGASGPARALLPHHAGLQLGRIRHHRTGSTADRTPAARPHGSRSE